MTNLDSTFKSRDVTLPTKVRLVKAMVFPVVIYGCGLWRKLSAEELMLLNCGVGEDSWESLGLQRDPTELNWWLKIPSACQMYNLSFKLSSKCQTCLFQCLFDISLDVWLSSVQFSHSVVSNSLRPHELQHARPPWPSPSPGLHSNSCQSSRWCHLAVSSSVIPFSPCLQSFPTSGIFPVSQFFTSGGQSIEVSASASVLTH